MIFRIWELRKPITILRDIRRIRYAEQTDFGNSFFTFFTTTIQGVSWQKENQAAVADQTGIMAEAHVPHLKEIHPLIAVPQAHLVQAKSPPPVPDRNPLPRVVPK